MAPVYLVNLGNERLLFDANRQLIERRTSDENDPNVPLPIWPAEEYGDTEEFASSSDWDEALAGYSQEGRAAAKVRLLVEHGPE